MVTPAYRQTLLLRSAIVSRLVVKVSRACSGLRRYRAARPCRYRHRSSICKRRVSHGLAVCRPRGCSRALWCGESARRPAVRPVVRREQGVFLETSQPNCPRGSPRRRGGHTCSRPNQGMCEACFFINFSHSWPWNESVTWLVRSPGARPAELGGNSPQVRAHDPTMLDKTYGS